MEGPTERQHRQYSGSLLWLIFGMTWGSFTYGYTLSIIATTLGQPSFFRYMGLDTNPHSEGLIGACVALFFAGGFFGAASTWYIADRWGRKIAITIGCIIVLIGGALTAGAVNIAMFLFFRFITGGGCLMLVISVPLWIAEIAPPGSRGVLAGMHALMSNLGYTTSAYVGVGFYFYQSAADQEWRAPLALICLWPIINLAIIPFVPESPRYLVSKGRENQALQILQQLHSRPDDPNHDFAKAEYYQINMQHELDQTLPSSWAEVLKRPSYRKRMLIAASLTVFCNTCGPLVVTNYAAKTFAGLDFSAEQALLFIAGFGPVSVLGMLLSLLYVDRVPRNITISLGIFLCTVALSCEAAVTAQYLGTSNKAGLAAGVAFVFVFIFFYNLVLEGPSWWYNAEIFPTHLRAKGMTMGICIFCLCNILWLQLAPTAFANIGWKFYLVFICISCVSATTVFLVYPDTLNKPLEEVAKMFGDDDLVAIYQRDIHIDCDTHEVIQDKIMDDVVEQEYVTQTKTEA